MRVWRNLINNFIVQSPIPAALRAMNTPDAENVPSYRPAEDISSNELLGALNQMKLLGDDPNLRSQAFMLTVVDQFDMKLEYQLLEQLHREEATPIPETTFLSAQSQMWIFAVYELLRTWRQRAKQIVKWAERSRLESKLAEYEKDIGYQHFGRQIRAAQIKRVLNSQSALQDVRRDIRKTHIPFARVEAIRIAIAKHEVRHQRDSVALMPIYGRMNKWCGAIDYELENGFCSLGYISRRDIADELRAIAHTAPPSDEAIEQFESFMRGPEEGPLVNDDDVKRPD